MFKLSQGIAKDASAFSPSEEDSIREDISDFKIIVSKPSSISVGSNHEDKSENEVETARKKKKKRTKEEKKLRKEKKEQKRKLKLDRQVDV
jgi:hypothetical protein